MVDEIIVEVGVIVEVNEERRERAVLMVVDIVLVTMVPSCTLCVHFIRSVTITVV